MKKIIALLVVVTVVLIFYTVPFIHSFWKDFQSIIAQLQQYLKIMMTELTAQLRQGDIFSLVWVVGLTFIYGVIHAIGPGHGKALIASFIVVGQATPKRAMIQGILAALLHGFSAIVVVTLIQYFAMGRTGIVFNVWHVNLQVVAYSLISLLGLFLVVSQSVELIRKRIKSPQPVKKAPEWWMWLFLGLIPCPGTMIILLFFMSQKLLTMGVFLAIVMSLGMAVTLGTVGLFSVYCRDFVQRTQKVNCCSSWGILFNSLGLIGASLVLLGGLVLLKATLA